MNTMKEVFRGLRKDKDLADARDKMIRGLESWSVDSNIIARIRQDKVLSITQWEEQAIADLTGFQSFALDAMEYRPVREYQSVDDEIQRRIDNIGTGAAYEVALASWNIFLTNQVSGRFSLPDAEKLHAQVGRAISSQLLNAVGPHVRSVAICYRRYIAYERLVLIRLASRIYWARHHKYPVSLGELADEKLLEKGLLIDPLSDQAFLLRKGGGFSVYSVGEDFIDNGGILYDFRKRTGDIVLVPLRYSSGK